MASKHGIEECIEKIQSHKNRCTYQTPSNTPHLNLTCVVSGFKPNISMLWTDGSGKRLDSTLSLQKTLPDDTYERFETITVSAKHGTEQTFTCTSTGDSLNGTSTEKITLLPKSGKRDNLGFIIGLVIGVPVAVFIPFLLVGKCLQNYLPDTLPRKGCGWNPCWRRPHEQKRFDEEEQFMMTSHPPVIVKKQVQQCKEELKKYYLESRRTVTVDPLNFMERVNLDEIYTNLSLIDGSNMRKTPITYEDILVNDESGKLSKRLLVEGEGGVGKTTLCAKIAWDWCQGRILHDLDMVIVIPLRDVTDDQRIGAIVKSYLSDSNATTPEQIDGYISTNLSKILLVFDGFDEYSEDMEERSKSEVIRILSLEQYKSCKVIVTTRPWKSHDFKMTKKLAETYTFISVEGFNEENLAIYISRYFRIREKNALADSLTSFMEENDVIRSNMAPFPIYCAMLCLMWNDFSEEKRTEIKRMQTFSEIFGEIISFLKEHYASKVCERLQDQEVDDYLTEAGRAIQDIGEIALNGLIHTKLSFPEKHFKKCHDAMTTCCRVGVLTIEKDVTREKRRRNVNVVESSVSFPHKLFQEYVAGLYVANIYVNDRAKYEQLRDTLLCRYQEFRYLLYFASALGNEIGLDIMNGLRKYNDTDFCVDLAFECHNEDAARAVGERWKEYKLSRNMSEHTTSGVVFMVHCDQVRSLSIDDVNCGRTASRDLAEGMCSRSALRKVNITHSKFHSDFYTIIADHAASCQIQDVSLSFGSWDDGSQHHSPMGKNMANWVFTMSSLSSFSLKCPYVDGDFLSKAITSSSSCQIQDLRLSFYSWDNSPQHHSSIGNYLAQWVFAMPKLSSFSLDCPHLDGDFLSAAIASASSCQIRNLKLSLDYGPNHQSSIMKKLTQWVQNLKLPFRSLDDGPQLQSSIWGELTQLVFTMPSLSSFSMTCPYLDGDFFSTVVATTSSCEVSRASK
ncbi:uncharacterized protein [Diadema setosum]|uniref:uncharacterized protein isoform X2 n=1 Tax=Diadema setosum TaxID=31175 RepID=UPI003B3A50AD